jgi:hypothetical protein
VTASAQPRLAEPVHYCDGDGKCRAAIVAGVQQHGDAPATADLVVLDASPPDGLPLTRGERAVDYAHPDAGQWALRSWHHRRDCTR